MLISDQEMAAIVAREIPTIERVSERIYSKLYTFLKENMESGKFHWESLRYENLRPAFLLLFVESLALASQVQNNCHAILSGRSDNGVKFLLESIERGAGELSVNCSVILSFDETVDFRIQLTEMHFDAAFRRAKYPVFTMQALDARVQSLLPQLEAALSRGKLSGKDAELISVALARLTAVCELLVQQVQSLLSSRSKWLSYALMCHIFALVIELYARSFAYPCIYLPVKYGNAK